MSDVRPVALTALGLVLVCAVAVESSRRVPAPLSATAPVEAFSAGRGMEHVRAMAQRPRPGGSAEHTRVREYLLATLRGLGLEPIVQEATGVGTHNSVAGRIVNVVARIPGARPGPPAILLAAHYDGVPAGAAAADDGAGVAVLLEAARALRAGRPLAHDVILLFSDGEEAGLTGAAAFVREHPWARDVAAVLNLDSGGTRGQSIAYQIATANTDLVTPLRQTGVIGNSIVSSLFAILPYDTDVSELARLGQPAVSVGLVDGSQVYHTSVDDVSHLDAGSLQHHGAQVLALTRSLANGPLPRPRMDDAVFFTMPVLGMVAYPAKWAPLLAILAGVIVAIGVVRFARRTPGWFRDVALGFAGVIGTTVLGTSIAGGVGAVMERMLVPAPVMGWSDARGLSASGIALLVIALASVGWAVIRRWASRRGAHLGALAFVAVLALLVSWKLTGASFLFTVPTLAAGAAALVAERENGPAPTIARWIAVLVALFVIVPIAYSMAVVETGVGVAGAAVLGLLGSLTAWLLAPQLEALRTRHTWATPAVATGSAMLLLASVVAIARRGTNYPTPSMLAYAVDAESSAAWLLAPARFARAGSWSATVLGGSARLVRPSAPATIPGAAHTWLTRAIAGELPTLVASTRRVEVGVLDIVVVSDSIRDGERRLTLRIRPAPGTYSVRLRAPGSRIDSAAVDGRVIEAPSNRSRPALWSLGYVTPPDEGFDLALSVRGHEPLEIEAITRSLGLPPAVAVALPQRPAGVVPVHAGDQTVVHRRFRF